MTITMTINGTTHTAADDQAQEKLLDYLHDELDKTGTKLCCGIGVCRACTVQVTRPASDVSEPVIACSTPIGSLNGATITTIEGVANGTTLHPIQDAFLRHFSFQCGYCTPGFVMAAKIFLEWLETADVPPDELDAQIEDAIGPHICRCTGYVRYYEAVRELAEATIARRAEQ